MGNGDSDLEQETGLESLVVSHLARTIVLTAELLVHLLLGVQWSSVTTGIWKRWC